MARTINRFAMGPEPHVGVWGVGYLPRNLANAYVKLVKGIPYEHIYLESFGSLQRSIHAIGDVNFETRIPRVTEADYAHHPVWKQQLFKVYSGLMQMPALGAIMARLGPYVDVASKSDLANAALQSNSVEVTSKSDLSDAAPQSDIADVASKSNLTTVASSNNTVPNSPPS